MDIPTSNSTITRTYFQRQLRSLQRDVLRMGALVENSCCLARQALFEQDLAAAKRIKPQDRIIDRFYRQIEQDCISTIALQSPVTKDLRLLSSMMQLVRDLERIGDYTKDFSEIAIKLFAYPPHPIVGEVQLMYDRCQSMLAMSLVALSNLDAQTGREIKLKDDLVDADYKILYNKLADRRNIQEELEPTLLLVLVIRHLERMADRSTNIGQRVAYIVTGKRG
ncbi:phosphate signaling complex protein PhoU [Roseofilum casamattae]|uniref:Phosphate-specific transport system accessory protein PhoU n=1 Tax=Roseofilum casamattae BLCC-M143 TaxID=3022442 RepID=A0ABT7BRN7_9CYAN|nr:phosphate signaling complex protein PhoU [Roseofilum casamattae]MDJ1181859.1 phosphate signaling complex protein PhoU [Roseofilum casamattae BLCC-M143]